MLYHLLLFLVGWGGASVKCWSRFFFFFFGGGGVF